ncbi:MAG: biotin carboxylase N-terminal domain-containing protein [Caulobacteraceae bacterium]
MIESVLIANRGEIARRIIRTARRMGLRTVAVYSEADAEALHVKEADKAVLIGPPPAAESYLLGDKIVAAAKETGAEAIHPGYGFLSENAEFAEAVIAAGLIWVGPNPAAIRAMGLKDAAKDLMAKAGVPVTPGYLGEDQSDARLLAEAMKIGWPVLIKAVAGGGGKGMRKVERPEDFEDALASARREAENAFGDDRVLLEKYIARARHIEVQVFGDKHGGAVHLFERDCSLQRRHQKVIEEAPAPGMDEATRAAICGAAVRAAQAVNYDNAGTIEFIADASGPLSAERIWFMEMNTRLQVEHPVTEAITGVDLVEWQLRVASGEPLPLKQEEIQLFGHAVEARLYAEDPATGFLPSTGTLKTYRLEGAARIDSGIEQGKVVSPFYDPMLAKVISHAADRGTAIAALREAFEDSRLLGVKTNAGFLTRCLANAAFVAGKVDTGLIEADLAALTAKPPLKSLDGLKGKLNWSGPAPGGFRLNAAPAEHAVIFVDGAPREASFTQAQALADQGGEATLFEGGETYQAGLVPAVTAASGGGDGALRSPMPGKIAAVAVALGEAVAKGDVVVVLEAMKMEHALKAPFDGKVAELTVKVGDQVREGVLLARLEA